MIGELTWKFFDVVYHLNWLFMFISRAKSCRLHYLFLLKFIIYTLLDRGVFLRAANYLYTIIGEPTLVLASTDDFLSWPSINALNPFYFLYDPRLLCDYLLFSYLFINLFFF